MRKEILRAVHGTTIEHDLCKHFSSDIRHPGLTPEMTMPVFDLPIGVVLKEVVAVTYRDDQGHPVDGGLFGVALDGEVVEISLVDSVHGVNTDENPAWVAFGLILSVGALLVRGEGGTSELPWSIIDFGSDSSSPLMGPTSERVAVKNAFVELLKSRDSRVDRPRFF